MIYVAVPKRIQDKGLGIKGGAATRGPKAKRHLRFPLLNQGAAAVAEQHALQGFVCDTSAFTCGEWMVPRDNPFMCLQLHLFPGPHRFSSLGVLADVNGPGLCPPHLLYACLGARRPASSSGVFWDSWVYESGHNPPCEVWGFLHGFSRGLPPRFSHLPGGFVSMALTTNPRPKVGTVLCFPVSLAPRGVS